MILSVHCFKKIHTRMFRLRGSVLQMYNIEKKMFLVGQLFQRKEDLYL